MISTLNKILITSVFSIFTISSFAQTARVQAIHNCPDPMAATVDIWLNNTRILDDISYKEASPYIDAPAGVTFDLRVSPSNSIDTTNALFTKSFTLTAGDKFTVVASGGLAESGNTAFDLRAYSGSEEANNQGSNEVSVQIIHGSYDAPEVDIYEVQAPAGELAADVEFGEGTANYLDLGAADYDIQLRTQTGIVAAEFDVDISSLVDSAVTVLATGYLDPSSAVGSEPFGLIAVLPNGTVLTLPSKMVTPAKLQVIHNCAATDADTVDIWLDNTVLLDDFTFRKASTFIDAPAGKNFDVSIALPSSTDTSGALFKQTFLLESAKTYIVVASGIVGNGTYDPITPFSLEVITEARETSTTSGNVDVLVFHGSTDAPTVDVVETKVGAGTIVDNLAYGQKAGYLDLAATSYNLDITDETGNTTVARFDADISSLSDNAITILASGFLDPIKNNNGEAFGLYVATPAGGDLLQLPTIQISSIDETLNQSKFEIFPNPSSDIITVSNISKASYFNITDISGKVLQQGMINVGQSIDISTLSPGTYYLIINEDDSMFSHKIIKK